MTDLASAHQAIDTIVEQGEGTRARWQDAHYGKFLQVLGELLEMRRADPSPHDLSWSPTSGPPSTPSRCRW